MAVIVGILIFAPTDHASVHDVFTQTQNNSGFSHSMFWWYVLPLGFLLTQYTITGFDASAHVSEETHDAALSRAARRLAVGVLLRRHRLHRAAGDHVRRR